MAADDRILRGLKASLRSNYFIIKTFRVVNQKEHLSNIL